MTFELSRCAPAGPLRAERATREIGLDDPERRAALDIDAAGLLTAARSYELERAGRSRGSRFAIWRWLLLRKRVRVV